MNLDEQIASLERERELLALRKDKESQEELIQVTFKLCNLYQKRIEAFKEQLGVGKDG